MDRVAPVIYMVQEHTYNLVICLDDCMHRKDFVLAAIILKEQRVESGTEQSQKKDR